MLLGLLLTPPARAATTSADSALFAFDTRIPNGTASGDAVVFVLDTRGNVGLNSATGSGTFVLDTSALSLSVPVVMSGQVTDANGIGLAEVTVSAMLGQTVVAQATTDANGNYQLPALSGVAYVLSVSASGYANSGRCLTLSSGAATQNFQLTALPAAPTTQQTTTQSITLPTDQWGSNLKVFDETTSTFVAITPANAPSPNLMTIVLTHGWVNAWPDSTIMTQAFDLWPVAMATQMRAHGIYPGVVNIVAWDWRYAAMELGVAPTQPVDRTLGQGAELGQALQQWLGTSYANNLHFLGHSLGALVNAAAINYLHGDGPSPSHNPWKNAPIHVTTFDGAETANIAGHQALFDGMTMSFVDPDLGGTMYLYEVVDNWNSAMPANATWADNYVSLIGFHSSKAVNIYLQRASNFGISPLDLAALHGYSYQWYASSIVQPTSSLLGFKWSEEYNSGPGLFNYPFPPSTSVFSLGASYWQESSSAQLDLSTMPWAVSELSKIPFVGSVPASVVSGAEQGTVWVYGTVTTDIESGAQATGQWIANGYNYAAGAAAQGWQTTVNLFNSPVLRLNLTTGPPSSSPQLVTGMVRPMGIADGNSSSNTPAMAWLPVQIPTNAVGMAFDYSVSGDPSNDMLVCGIGTNNLISLEAKYISTNGVTPSRLLDVSAWAGTTNELFFGLMGGTSTNATLQIDNIRFYSLQSPALVDSVGDGIPDSWRAQYFPNVDPTGTTTNYLSCATGDADGTGQNNWFKYLAGLNPTNSTSMFRILSIAPTGSDLNVTWQTVGGKTNVLTATGSMGIGYTNISPNLIIQGTGDTTTNWLDAGAATNRPARFYRIQLVP